jgi:hypothetical protein
MIYEKINGVRYCVTYVDGGKVYDPPLPDRERLEAVWSERGRELRKSRSCPKLKTDTEFHARRGTLVDQLGGDEAWAKFITKRAKQRGYTPGANDVYISQLVRSEVGPGDPQAWVKPSEGRAEIAKRCRDRGLGCDGVVKVKQKFPEAP